MLNRIVHHKYFVFFLPIVLLVAISFYLYPEWMNLPPSYVHQWAQADWYAMAMCYAKEDVTFGLPRTYAINTLFGDPSHWGSGITRADFPIHAYISGALMYYTNTFEPYIYRSYTLIYSIVGMFFLFKLTHEASKSIIWALCCMLLIFTNPIYAYYQVSFLPGVPSFANFLISLYFLYNYLKNKNNVHLYLSICFITLAELSRPSFAIYWIAFLLIYIWDCYKSKKYNLFHFIAFVGSFILQASSYFYNSYLTKEYGSMFLDRALPATSISDYFELISVALQVWGHDYLSQSQYIIFVMLIVACIVLLVSKKTFLRNNQTLGLLVLICLAGAISFTFLMARQFEDHDYYSIDSLLPVLILFLLFFSELISFENEKESPFAIGMLVVCCIFSISDCKANLYSRKNPSADNLLETIRAQYIGSGEYLDQLGISKSARLLLLNSYNFNGSLLELERKGYPILTTEPDSVEKALNFAYEYVVIRTNDVAHMLTVSPSMITRFEKVGSNNKISVYKKRPQQDGNILSFYGVKQENVLLADTSTFDVFQKKYNWDIIPERIVKNAAFSKPKSLFVDSLDFIGPMHTFKNDKRLAGKKQLNIILRMKTHFSTANKTIRLAYEVYRKSGKTFESEEILIEDILGNKWQNASCSVNLTLTKTSDIDKVVIFLWNPNKATYFADDIETYMYTE